MPDLVSQIANTVGQPASVRVGTIASLNPVVVTVQGAVMNNVGLIGDYSPQVGDPVILLGQSSQAGSDPASWVALGAASSSGLQTLFAMSTVTFNLGIAESAVPGTLMPFTTTAPQTLVEAWWTADFNIVGTTISTAVVRPILDGVIQTQVQAIVEMPVAAATGRWTLSNQANYVVGPGVHSIGLAAVASTAVMISLVAGSTTLKVNVRG